MKISSAVRVTAVLVFAMALLGGCKKETPQKTEAPPPAPAPATAPAPAAAPAQQATSGEALFKKHCASCHPDGGNIVKPDLTLHQQALAKHNITKPEDIVKVMRNPNPGMTKFDATVINDQDATVLAQYVLDTFK